MGNRIVGFIIKPKLLTARIDKGTGMGELPSASGQSEFPMPAYSVNGTDLTAVGEAIAEKAGVEKPVFPDGWIGAVEGIKGDTLAQLLSDELEEYEYRGVGWPSTFKFGSVTNLKELRLYPQLPVGTNGQISATIQGNTSIQTLKLVPQTGSFQIGPDFANGATALEKVELGNCQRIAQRAFSGCAALKALILSYPSLATLYNATAFNGTPIENGDGYIYVVKELLESYRTATNWTAYQFRAIEDYPELCGG